MSPDDPRCEECGRSGEALFKVPDVTDDGEVGTWYALCAECRDRTCVHLAANHEASTLTYRADFAAPRVGYAAECRVCGEDYAVIGGDVFLKSALAHIVGPEGTE